MKQKGKRLGSSSWRMWLIAAPGIVYLFINNYLPMFGVFLAFKDYKYTRGIFGSAWCGFDNFEFLFRTSDAWIMTRNTLLYNLSYRLSALVSKTQDIGKRPKYWTPKDVYWHQKEGVGYVQKESSELQPVYRTFFH